jgi:galactokinase/mevalonate kinase-like predicted kinase
MSELFESAGAETADSAVDSAVGLALEAGALGAGALGAGAGAGELAAIGDAVLQAAGELAGAS